MLKVEIQFENINDALDALNVLKQCKGVLQSIKQSEIPSPVAMPVMPAAPAPAPAPVMPAPAPAPVQAAPPAMPTAQAPTYTKDQIMVAGAQLIDAGKMNELVGLLNQFGVVAATELKPEQYGAFATEMRKLGAQI